MMISLYDELACTSVHTENSSYNESLLAMHELIVKKVVYIELMYDNLLVHGPVYGEVALHELIYSKLKVQ